MQKDKKGEFQDYAEKFGVDEEFFKNCFGNRKNFEEWVNDNFAEYIYRKGVYDKYFLYLALSNAPKKYLDKDKSFEPYKKKDCNIKVLTGESKRPDEKNAGTNEKVDQGAQTDPDPDYPALLPLIKRRYLPDPPAPLPVPPAPKEEKGETSLVNAGKDPVVRNLRYFDP